MSKNLFADDSGESDNEVTLNTNKEYAKSFNKLREKELYKKLKEQDLENSETDSSSESEYSEDDDVRNPKFDEEFFKTLASLKSKDPSIYNKEKQFFEDIEEDDADIPTGSRKHKKPLTLKDYERKIILEKGGKYEDDDDSDAEEQTIQRPMSPTYVQEQDQLRSEFRKALKDDDTEDEEFGGIFKKRVKSNEEKAKEEEEYTKWLSGKKNDEDVQEDVKETLAPLKEYWSKPNLNQREKFLRDYILNKGYSESNFAEIPTYDEIVGNDENLSDDEQELEKQAEFEQKYNFRFEDPDKDFIKRYPRTIENSVRQTDDKRKQKRQEVKERKEIEKQQKMRDLEILKELKRKEIEEKIRKLKEVTGNEELPFNTDELDDDFDPDAHDKRMQAIFNDEFYEVDEGEEKPECPDIDELKIEDWDNYDPRADEGSGNNEPHCEDEDFNMDCDYDANSKQSLQQELIENTLDNKKRRRRRNRFMEMIKTDKPAFDPEDEKTYGEYIEEYYKMDCEDMIGDTPCRFKYVETTPNDFGLTIEEILLAKNKELNQWASLKKAIQIRPDHVEKKDQRLYKMKANNEDLKRKIFRSLYGPSSDEEEEEEKKPVEPAAQEAPKKKKKKSKKRKQAVAADDGANQDIKKTKVEVMAVAENSAHSNKTEDNILPTKHIQVPEEIEKKSKNQKNKLSNTNAESSNPEQKSEEKKISKSKNQAPTSSGVAKKFNKKGSNPFESNKNKFKNGNKFKANQNNSDNGVKLSAERLKAYGINPRKFHNKQKFGNKSN